MSPIVPLVLLGLAAGGGLTMAAIRSRHRNPPKFLAAGHGLLALAGLVTLVFAQGRRFVGDNFLLAIPFLGVAAIVGLVLAALHRQGKLLPPRLIALHAVLALLGFALALTGTLWNDTP